MSKAAVILSAVIGTIIFACGTDNGQAPVPPSSADREKFIGRWAGAYECGNPQADTLIIVRGSNDLAFKITLHAQAFNADVADGELTDATVITIPEQTLGGFPGSATIIYDNSTLSLSQTGLGITCSGSNYSKFQNN